jgi:hypothetical protein
MLDTPKPKTLARYASDFIAPTGQRRSAFNIWEEAGRATEQAYRVPMPMRLTVRIAVALALVVVAKLCSGGSL